MALSLCPNSARGTMTSAIWNVTDRPWRTILAPILTSRSRNVVIDPWLTALGMVRHTVYVDAFPGPYPFLTDPDYPGKAG
jgi:hypothetical protein